MPDSPKRPSSIPFLSSPRIWTGGNLGTGTYGSRWTIGCFGSADVVGFFSGSKHEILIRLYFVDTGAPFSMLKLVSVPRDVLQQQYDVPPMWYTAFRKTGVTGVPALRSIAQGSQLYTEDRETLATANAKWYYLLSRLECGEILRVASMELAAGCLDKAVYASNEIAQLVQRSLARKLMRLSARQRPIKLGVSSLETYFRPFCKVETDLTDAGFVSSLNRRYPIDRKPSECQQQHHQNAVAMATGYWKQKCAHTAISYTKYILNLK
ncbi:hypothetical protein BD410DRAFT_806895 [Rickenella mellea]|uniref:Uncharacterized protein n=1 Tax=Rickenella mellea TaxID=50990 RepID=A0A4Y7PRR6_9AGAM|nr:hypothetical protein BD410DRAFT_806895 [Rickenella mellea]